jgi:hypothetical protein
MARPRVLPQNEEAATIRLRLQVEVSHDDALAAVRAGYLTAAEIAAADDEEFVRALGLPAPRAHEILAAARSPGSRAPDPGQRPRVLREEDMAPAVARATAPVIRAMAKALGEGQRPPEGPTGPKPAPPHAGPDRARRKRLRDEAEAAERDLDEALDAGGPP